MKSESSKTKEGEGTKKEEVIGRVVSNRHMMSFILFCLGVVNAVPED